MNKKNKIKNTSADRCTNVIFSGCHHAFIMDSKINIPQRILIAEKQPSFFSEGNLSIKPADKFLYNIMICLPNSLNSTVINLTANYVIATTENKLPPKVAYVAHRQDVQT